MAQYPDARLVVAPPTARNSVPRRTNLAMLVRILVAGADVVTPGLMFAQAPGLPLWFWIACSVTLLGTLAYLLAFLWSTRRSRP